MKMICRAAVIGSVLVAGLLGGCAKKVDVVFTNLTADDVDLVVMAPQKGRMAIGTLGPRAGRRVVGLKFDKDKLPARVTWKAGPAAGSIPVNKQTPRRLWVDIRPDGKSRSRDETEEFTDEEKTDTRTPLGEPTEVIE